MKAKHGYEVLKQLQKHVICNGVSCLSKPAHVYQLLTEQFNMDLKSVNKSTGNFKFI